MYRESSSTGSCKTAIHKLQSHLHSLRPGSPGRWSKAASMRLTRSCTRCLPAGAALQVVEWSASVVMQRPVACTTVRVFKAVSNSCECGQAYRQKA